MIYRVSCVRSLFNRQWNTLLVNEVLRIRFISGSTFVFNPKQLFHNTEVIKIINVYYQHNQDNAEKKNSKMQVTIDHLKYRSSKPFVVGIGALSSCTSLVSSTSELSLHLQCSLNCNRVSSAAKKIIKTTLTVTPCGNMSIVQLN